jgi:hypothetical protein
MILKGDCKSRLSWILCKFIREPVEMPPSHRLVANSIVITVLGVAGLVQWRFAEASTVQIIASIPGVEQLDGPFTADADCNLYMPVAGESDSSGGALYEPVAASGYSKAKLL